MKKKISDELSIIDYEPQHAQAFYDLNYAWIAKAFVVEDNDKAVLSDPKKYILDGGGTIILAVHNGKIVGTCALTDEGHDTYEMTKMSVDEAMRGQHIGYHLGVAILEKAKELGAKKVILHSNKQGSAAAIQLYYKLGFKEIPLGDAPWKRANIKMEIHL